MSCIVLIGGVPGSGKTKFISFFVNYFTKLYGSFQEINENIPPEIHVIAFDDLCSIEDQAKISKSVNGWRNFRLQILEAAERYICNVCDINCLVAGPLSYRSTELIEVIEKCNNFNLPDKESSHFNIFLIEDNFYYRSMRYEWFQVARRANIGFCEIFMSCPLNVALQRNETRNYSIPERLIKFMYSSMELPDPTKNKWEKFSLIFETKEEFKESKICDVMKFIQTASSEPAEIVINEDKIIAQKICSKNVTHQVDKALRKLTGKVIKDIKDHESSEFLKDRISKVVTVRQTLLSEIREQKLTLPNDIIEDIQYHGTMVEDISDRLEVFLGNILIKKLEILTT